MKVQSHLIQNLSLNSKGKMSNEEKVIGEKGEKGQGNKLMEAKLSKKGKKWYFWFTASTIRTESWRIDSCWQISDIPCIIRLGCIRWSSATTNSEESSSSPTKQKPILSNISSKKPSTFSPRSSISSTMTIDFPLKKSWGCQILPKTTK